MSAGWVAGSVRGRLLVRRRLGTAGARAVAGAESAAAAVALVAESPYGHRVDRAMSVDDASRAVRGVCLWHLRVLAGWLPPRGGDVVRTFAARFELDDIGDRLLALGDPTVPLPAPLDHGGLGIAWSRVAVALSPDEVRSALARSAWGDPGATDWPSVAPVLEARWCTWLAAAAPPDMGHWAVGAAALVAASAVATGVPLPPGARVDLRRLVGRQWEDARDLTDLVEQLPRSGAWALDGVDDGRELWRGESRWWQRIDHDAAGMLRTARPGPGVAAASAARLVADMRRTRSALEAVRWGAAGLEVFDAVA